MVEESKCLQKAFSAVTALKGLLCGMDAPLWLWTGAREGWPLLRAPSYFPLIQGASRPEAFSGWVVTLLFTCAGMFSRMDSTTLHLAGRSFSLHPTQAT